MPDVNEPFETVGRIRVSEEELRKVVQISEYLAKSETLQAETRGNYLLKASELEFYIDELIAHHFCHDEALHNQLCELVLRKINFRPKKAVLEKVLESYTDNPFSGLKMMLPDLEKIIEFRNKLAHTAPSLDHKSMQKPFDNKILLRRYENGKVVTSSISKQDLDEKLNDVRSAVGIIYAMDLFVQEANKKKTTL